VNLVDNEASLGNHNVSAIMAANGNESVVNVERI